MSFTIVDDWRSDGCAVWRVKGYDTPNHSLIGVLTDEYLKGAQANLPTVLADVEHTFECSLVKGQIVHDGSKADIDKRYLPLLTMGELYCTLQPSGAPKAIYVCSFGETLAVVMAMRG